MADIAVQKSDLRGSFEAPPIGNYGGDYAFAGMLLARAAIDSSVICTNLSAASEQSGRAALDILRCFGVRVTRSGDSVNVRESTLSGCSVDLEYPPVAPMVMMLALFAKGKTHLCGFAKAPDLQQLLIENLMALGARYEYNGNDLWIWPHRFPGHCVLNGGGHPLMTMSLILLGTCIQDETAVRNADGLLERYPDFLSILRSLGGKADVREFSL